MQNDPDRHDTAEPAMSCPRGLDVDGRKINLLARGSHGLGEIGSWTISRPATCSSQSANKTPGVIDTTGRLNVFNSDPDELRLADHSLWKVEINPAAGDEPHATQTEVTHFFLNLDFDDPVPLFLTLLIRSH